MGQAKRDFFAPFPTTAWTLIRQAQHAEAAQRAESLNELLSRYWKPLYTFFWASVRTADEAEDLVQGFWCRFVEDDRILRADEPQKRFRNWLRVCARNYLIDEKRHAKGKGRKPAKPIFSLDAFTQVDGRPFEPMHMDAEVAFQEAWRRSLLERALNRVSRQCSERGRLGDYDLFWDYYGAGAQPGPTWRQLADRYGITDMKQATRKADWVKAKLREAIREEIRPYTSNEQEVDEEIMELLA